MSYRIYVVTVSWKHVLVMNVLVRYIYIYMVAINEPTGHHINPGLANYYHFHISLVGDLHWLQEVCNAHVHMLWIFEWYYNGYILNTRWCLDLNGKHRPVYYNGYMLNTRWYLGLNSKYHYVYYNGYMLNTRWCLDLKEW